MSSKKNGFEFPPEFTEAAAALTAMLQLEREKQLQRMEQRAKNGEDEFGARTAKAEAEEAEARLEKRREEVRLAKVRTNAIDAIATSLSKTLVDAANASGKEKRKQLLEDADRLSSMMHRY